MFYVHLDLDSPRQTSVQGGKLPSARAVSNDVFRSKKKPPKNKKRTMMLMEWGQFLDHDLDKTPVSRGKEIHTGLFSRLFDAYPVILQHVQLS